MALFLDGETGVVDAAVFEEVLFSFLEFNDKAFPLGAVAVEVKNGFAVDLGGAQVFSGGVGEVLDLVVGRQQAVEKVDEKGFVGFGTEQFFEAEISEGVEVAIGDAVHGDRGGEDC